MYKVTKRLERMNKEIGGAEKERFPCLVDPVMKNLKQRKDLLWENKKNTHFTLVM